MAELVLRSAASAQNGSAAETLQRWGSVGVFPCMVGSPGHAHQQDCGASLCGACSHLVNGLQDPSCLCPPVVSFSNYVFIGK